MKKVLYLFLALLLPALVFVFLKYAGRNEFNIPVYFEEGVTNPPLGCEQNYAKPYLIANSIWPIKEGIQGQANVLVFPARGLDFNKLKSAIDEEFGPGKVWLKEACLLAKDSVTCNVWRKCIFLVEQPNQTVLMDKEGRLRGYYDLQLREEVDRLRVELKILMKKY